MLHILTILPAESFVDAAFAELLKDVDNLLASAGAQRPQDKEELAFWRRQSSALNKAESYYRQGVALTLAPDAYLLPSASRPGALVHRLRRLGGVLVCDCEASAHGRLCWHAMLISVVERAAELESLAEDEAERRISRAMTKARRELMEAA